MARKAIHFKIGEAQNSAAFLTNPEGYDICLLVRDQDGFEPVKKITDEEWQEIIDVVNMAPEMLAALKALRTDLENGGEVYGSDESRIQMITGIIGEEE